MAETNLTASIKVIDYCQTSIHHSFISRRLILAVVASGLVGLVIDSLLFLQLAFGNLDFLTGQIMGKAWVVLLAIPVIWLLREWDLRRGVQAA